MPRVSLVSLLALAILAPVPVDATPITATGPFYFREAFGPNDVGVSPGDFLVFGVFNVVPNGAATPPTTGIATQGAATRTLFFKGFAAAPNEFDRIIPYDPALTGTWTMTFTNGPDTKVVTTPLPAVGSAPPVPFATSLAMTGAGPTPTFSWTAPPPTAFDQVFVLIYDLEGRTGPSGPIPDIIHFENRPKMDTSYTVPAVLSSGRALVEGRRYVIAIEMDAARPGAVTGSAGDDISAARAFFSFSLLDPGTPSVFLPTDTAGGAFRFDIAVLGGKTVFIDPLVAIGYDYAIGAGDPNFASVLLPAVGDGLYDLYLWDGASFLFDQVLAAGAEHGFGPGGVDRFRILGIEENAMLDPLDVTAFITGLTFTDSGRFTGTMTPITAEVPAPATLLLLVVAAGAAGALARRRRFR